MGYTTVLKVEKRVAGYLTHWWIDEDNLNEFDRLVLNYGADVCAIEMAKNRAIASAVEQTRGDWIQMWLSGTPADDDLLRARGRSKPALSPARTLCRLGVSRRMRRRSQAIGRRSKR